MIKHIIFFSFLFLSFTASSIDALKPVGHAQKLAPTKEYTILLPNKASEQDIFASELLVKYLEKITNIKLPIKKEPFEGTGKIISIGETNFAKHNKIAQCFGQTYSLSVVNKNLFIKGSVYGVIAFLEEDLKVRWYRKDENPVIPVYSKGNLTVVPRTYTPVFEMREPIFDEAWKHTKWGTFNKIQPFSYYFNIPRKMGGGISNSKYFIHTYDEIIPAKKYFASNPDLFPMRNGKRFASKQFDGQLCYTNPKVAQIMAQELALVIEKQKGSRLYSVSQNDNNNSNCECVTCKKLIAKEGLSGATILLANRVAQKLATKYPDIKISTLAYNGTQKVPPSIKPSKNTVIFYAPIRQRAMALQYLPWDDVEIITKELKDWKKVTQNIYVWDYVNTPRIVPFPNFDVVDKNFKLWAKSNVKGVLLESAEYWLNSLGALKAWVFTKKLWNPAWDINLLIEEFIENTYGKAAPEIKKYVALQRLAWKEFYQKKRPGDSVKFSTLQIAQMQKLLENAYQKTPNKKIAQELCCFYATTLTVCTKNNIIQYEKNLNRVKELLKKHNLTFNVREKYHKMVLDDWHQQLNDVKNGTVFPLYSPNSLILKDRDLHSKVKFVPDKHAITGKAARQIKKTDWCVQWNFKKFLAAAPNQSVYVARIRLKTDFKSSYPDNANACSLHLWRAGIRGVQGRFIKFNEIQQSGYQFVYAFKVYMYTPAISGYFYNCIGNLAEGDAICYDYIEFIPESDFKDKELLKKLPTITL
jgi:hypothetical protein